MRARAAVTALLVVGLLVVWPDPVLASCGGTPRTDEVSGYEHSAFRRGTRADVYVNNFGQNPYDSWRAVGIFLNSNNFVETGWFQTQNDNTPHPYKTWKSGGVIDSVDFYGIDLNDDAFHEFKAHDQNGDRHWSFAADGNPLGNEFADFSLGDSRSSSERSCTSDSLYANFRQLNRISCVGCSWLPYESLYQYKDTPMTNDYDFCRLSNTSFDVGINC